MPALRHRHALNGLQRGVVLGGRAKGFLDDDDFIVRLVEEKMKLSVVFGGVNLVAQFHERVFDLAPPFMSADGEQRGPV